ncbi:MAG: alpha-galactosidase [Clostridia bacterium]|nr:alpha-galactosidase [Clostridia bacterium]
MQVKKKFIELENITLLYVDVDGLMSFTVIPTALKDAVTDDKFDMQYIRNKGFTHVRNKPMVQIALKGDIGEKEFFAGNCMGNSSSCYEFAYRKQTVKQGKNVTEVVTFFENGKGQVFEHHVKKEIGVNALECFNVIENTAEKEIAVEMISSFSISSISPFCAENDVDNIYLHRLQTNWSAEGKLETFTAADLEMEDSWSSYGIRQARIGSVGSLPCRKHMPFYAVEDRGRNCTWAVSLEAPISWYIDATHHQTSINLTGGITDFETGQFRKILRKGESYRTYSGFVTAVCGGLENAAAALQECYAARLVKTPSEEDIPVIYNEYCFSWGNPDMATLKPIIDKCADLNVKEFVVDVGWWRQDERSWYTFGDWNPSGILFPYGMRELTDYIRSKGMIPGLWFEFEGVSTDSLLFGTHRDYMLTRDGDLIQHRERALLDFRKPEVKEYITEKVIGLLKKENFGYVKIDYNDGLGIGCDGAESYGEGMRRHIEEVMEFIREIRREIPGIVIEICSSGGHRLEPKFLSLADMASFSDAHEGLEGAVIAADLHRYMLPRQMQIWATLRQDYSLARIYFTICKGMLGRYCLSGNLLALDKVKYSAVERSVCFYERLKPTIKNGKTLVNINDNVTSLRHLHGVRYLVRYGEDGTAVAWLFGFGKGRELTVRNECFCDYEIDDAFVYGTAVKETEDSLTIRQTEEDEMIGAVILLKKVDK